VAKQCCSKPDRPMLGLLICMHEPCHDPKEPCWYVLLFALCIATWLLTATIRSALLTRHKTSSKPI
jgi:hypothetical protein